jgi:hypothetical protein
MSVEEKNLCNIFQSFNTKAVECMKNQAYRDIMLNFWATGGDEHLCDMMRGTGMKDDLWTMSNAKAMLITMLTTSYNVMFQRLACKVACVERYTRFLEILKYYRQWFVDSRCMADLAHVKNYEETQIAKMTDAQSFTGMYAEFVKISGTRVSTDKKPPAFHFASADDIRNRTTIRGKAEIGPPPTTEIVAIDSDQQLKLQVIYARVHAYVEHIVGMWIAGNTLLATAFEEGKNVAPVDQDLVTVAPRRQKLAYDVYVHYRDQIMAGKSTHSFEASFIYIWTLYMKSREPEVLLWMKTENDLYDFVLAKSSV